LKICVVGWSLYEDFYKILKDSKYSVMIISHNSDEEKVSALGLPYRMKENIGLEFGAYDFYLKNIWDGKSNVLFTHDDTQIIDILVLDRIADLDNRGYDQAYLFKNKNEEVNNGGKHGRAIYMSAKLLSFILGYECTCSQSKECSDRHNPGTVLPGLGKHTGFWFDPYNKGHVSGKPPVGVRHYNEMIYHFHKYMGWVRDKKLGNESMNVVNRVYFPEYDCARRGKFRIERKKKK